jgi:predicted RNase H-like HicB family nuclease
VSNNAFVGILKKAKLKASFMTNYIAVIHKERKSDFGVSFPDFPGCITAGRTVDEAREMAEEALRGHVLMMVDEGLAMPFPSKLEDILKDRDFAGAAAYFIVNVDVPKPEPVRFNASMDAQLLARIDQKSREIGMTRSGFLAEAARKELAGRK